MKELLEKFSSYNIFNYLVPGVVFVVLGDAFTTYQLVQEDIVLGLFVYYFIGLVISRFGSVVIEPLLKCSKLVVFAPYADFVSASKADKMVVVLSEANNMYRTFCALFILLVVLEIFERISASVVIIGQWKYEFLIVGLLILFCFSYRKQCAYIVKRIECTKTKE